ncbi:MAG: response regulator [Planctomycetes bacterium]|nr:response regulator [Planctomycetota bacterium]
MTNSTSRTVLHIDDDPQVLRMIRHQLKGLGYEVVSLDNPSKAVGMLLKNEYRVVILDIDMPGYNGLDVLRQIKKQDGGIQVIMLTGFVSMTVVLQSLRWGAEACFFKPLTDVKPLASAVEEAFAKLDRWWETLRDLTNRKRLATSCLEESQS